MNKTKFEEDLKQFFPEIYKLHQYGKSRKYVWDAVYTIIEMIDEDQSGNVFIRFAEGHIDKVNKTEDLTFGRKFDTNK